MTKYKSQPAPDTNIPDTAILEAFEGRYLIVGRVGSTVTLYMKPPHDIWQANYTDMGLTKIHNLVSVPHGWRIDTEGYQRELKSPLGRYLGELVEDE